MTLSPLPGSSVPSERTRVCASCHTPESDAVPCAACGDDICSACQSCRCGAKRHGPRAPFSGSIDDAMSDEEQARWERSRRKEAGK